MTQEQMILAAARAMTMKIEELTQRNRVLEAKLSKMAKRIEYDAVTKLQLKSLIVEIEYLADNEGINEDKIEEFLNKILEFKGRIK